MTRSARAKGGTKQEDSRVMRRWGSVGMATVAGWWLLALTGGVSAEPTPTIRFEQRPLPSSVTKGVWTSHTGDWDGRLTDWRIFDDVRFERAERITEFRWQGMYASLTSLEALGNFPLVPKTNEWEVSIWSDKNGEPFEVLRSEQRPASEVPYSVRGTAHIRQWGVTVPRFEFAFEFSTPLEVVPGATYWISARSVGDAFWPFFVTAPGRPDGPGAAPTSREEVDALMDGGSFRQMDFYGVELTAGEYVSRSGYRAIAVLTVPVNDADQDGMDDEWEAAHGLDPGVDDSAEDPDADGLTNLGEFERRTNPMNGDMDGDGLPDGVESNTGVYVDENDRGTSPFVADSDRDGLSDDQEDPAQGFVAGMHAGSDPNWPDTDGDGFTDLEEVTTLGTNPSRCDSDGDGITDPWELAHGSNPSDAGSPVSIGMASLGRYSARWTSPQALPTFENYNGGLDRADVTFRSVIDFDEKGSGVREVIFEAGGGTMGFSLVREDGNLLVLRAVGNGGMNLAVLEYALSDAVIAKGEVEVIWAYDVWNEEGSQTIGLWIDGVVADEVRASLGGDWSGGNAAAFGVGSENLAADGNNGELYGQSFTSGRINLTQGLQVFTNTYPVTEIVIGQTEPQIAEIRYLPESGELTVRWRSEAGFVYNLRSATDPSIAAPIDWPIFEGHQNIVATLPENVLTIPLPGEARRLFVVEKVPAQP